MYKVIGADGREYGPIDTQRLAEWAAQGRVNAQTRVRLEGETEWKTASEIPELQEQFANLRAGVPPPMSAVPAQAEGRKGLAIMSLVLGILSLVCLNPITAIPAIICGHIAHNRARRSPVEYGGTGLAVAGFITGYLGLVLSIVAIAIYGTVILPALGTAKGRAQAVNCSNNMKQIGLAFKVWELSHSDQFPFNVATNAGGTLELCDRDGEGFEKDPAVHFGVLSNELSMTKVLTCPGDTKQAAPSWSQLRAANVSYLLRSGEKVGSVNPQEVLAVCPIHNNVLRADGSVQMGARQGRR